MKTVTSANVLIFNFSVLTQEASSQGISRCVLENFTKKIVPLQIKKTEEKFSKVNKLKIACYLKIKIKLNALKKAAIRLELINLYIL